MRSSITIRTSWSRPSAHSAPRPLGQQPHCIRCVVCRGDGLSGRGRGDAPAAANGLDAQPRTDDRRFVSDEGLAHRLAMGRTLVHGVTRRRGSAANNGGWQWTAGVGTDAAPYFRIFNPVLQGKKFDPYGDTCGSGYRSSRVSPRPTSRTWRMPPREQHDAACVIGRDYPPPLVDHAWARERTLAAYKSAR